MSMLAERKRKTKWIINPTKKPLWTADSNGIKFSKGLLEKMGWTPGKGLGVNEQGIQEPLKVSYKNDTKGMGFKGNDNDWIEYQDEFNCLLNKLRNSDESFVVKASDAEKNKAESLEEKSKCSKARVHYQKFTRGKDLSNYSENDLACILGTNKTNSKKSNTKEMTGVNYKADENFETHFGVTTINSGSIQDYFKKKWIFHNKSRDTPDAGDKITHNFQIKEAKNSKRKLNLNFKESADIKRTMTPESDEMEKREEKKKEKKREKNLKSEEEPEIKRRKKNNDFDLINDASVEVAFGLRKKKKESKEVFLEIENNDYDIEKSNIKNKNLLGVNDTNIEKELKYQKKKKEKRKTLKGNKELENKYTSSIQNTHGSDRKEFYQKASINGVNSEEENYVFQPELKMKKKKKKSKKQKHFDIIKDKIFCDISDALLNNQNIAHNQSCSEVELKKKKKKKKEKEKSAEKEEVECFDNCCRQNLINCNADGKTVKSKSEREISPNVMLILKQKKKKNKKEKLVEKEEIEFVADINLSLEKGNIQNTSEVEVLSESVRKKKKKKDKKEKSVEKEKVKNLKTCKNDIIDFCVQENKRTKKTQSFSEIESLKKKKKENSEKKNLLEIQFESENSISQTTNALKINDENVKSRNEINKRKLLSEVNSFKKKKKSEKGKLVGKEKTKFVEDCSSLNIEPSGEEENIKNASKAKGVSEVALIKKKHKKGKIKEVLNGLNKIESSKSNMKKEKINSVNEEKNIQEVELVNEKEQEQKQDNKNFIENFCENKESQENKVESKEEKIKKTDIINKKVGFTNLNKINYNCHINHKNDINFPQTGFGGIMGSLNLSQNSSSSYINNLEFLQNGYGCNTNSLSFPHSSLGYNINNYYSQINNNNNFPNHQNILNLFDFLYSYNYFNNMMSLNNSKIDREHEVRNHKMEFLNEKNVDKFYHGHNKRERILRLLYLSDFAKFKGSNVEKLMGYGIS